MMTAMKIQKTKSDPKRLHISIFCPSYNLTLQHTVNCQTKYVHKY